MSGLPLYLLSLFLLLAAHCSHKPATPDSSWSLQLRTAGGFAGVGTGNLSLTSDGVFKYTAPGRPNTERKACEGKLSNGEIKPVDAAVKEAQPKNWNRPGLDVAAPDAFGYDLDLQIGSNRARVHWYDNTKDQLPSDLKHLSDALMDAMKVAANQCSAQKAD